MVAAMRPFVQAEAETATKGEWPLSSPWNVLRRLSYVLPKNGFYRFYTNYRRPIPIIIDKCLDSLRTIRIIAFPFFHQLLLISFFLLFSNYYYYYY